MIGIGRHTDYASRVVLHLALMGPDAHVTAGEVAQRRLMPPAFIRRIIGKLASAGIVRTTRGAHGGVALARPASEISMLDVVLATEGHLALNPCVETPETCPLSSSCPVSRAWAGITQQLADALAAIRFDTLAAAPELQAPGPAADEKRGG